MLCCPHLVSTAAGGLGLKCGFIVDMDKPRLQHLCLPPSDDTNKCVHALVEHDWTIITISIILAGTSLPTQNDLSGPCYVLLFVEFLLYFEI